MENSIEDILRETPIETRLKVIIESHFIMEYGGTFFMPLDEDGNDIAEAIEVNEKCYKKAEPLLESVLEAIKEWKNDGCP